MGCSDEVMMLGGGRGFGVGGGGGAARGLAAEGLRLLRAVCAAPLRRMAPEATQLATFSWTWVRFGDVGVVSITLIMVSSVRRAYSKVCEAWDCGMHGTAGGQPAVQMARGRTFMPFLFPSLSLPALALYREPCPANAPGLQFAQRMGMDGGPKL